MTANRARVSKIDTLSAMEYFQQRVKKGTLESSSLSINCFKRKPKKTFPDFGCEEPVQDDVYLGPRCRCINEYLGLPTPELTNTMTNVGANIPQACVKTRIIDQSISRVDEVAGLMSDLKTTAISSALKKPVDSIEVDPLEELIGLMSCKKEDVPKKGHLD